MRMRRSGKSTASLAGWLFADLTLVLFVVSLAGAESGASCPPDSAAKDVPGWCDGSASTVVSTSTTTSTTTTTTTVVAPSTTEPTGPVGIKPDPIEITLTNWTAGTLALRLDVQLRDAYSKDPALRDLGKLDDIKFGVVIIYGGSRNRANNVGDKAADDASTALSASWSRVDARTYFETGHDQQLVAGGLKFKLFPVLG